MLAPRISSVGGQALDTARDDRLEQALDPLEITIAGHMQWINQDHGLPRLRRLGAGIFARTILETERAVGERSQ